MTIELELERLAKFYAEYDSDKQCYVSQLDQEGLLSLDKDFEKVINQQLLSTGASKGKIATQYRIISLKFHPDKKKDWSPEVNWIETNLSAGKNDGVCFRSVDFCYEKLTSPSKFKNTEFGDIRTKEDCKKWLESLKVQAATYTTRSLYESLIDLLDQSSDFFDEAGKIKPTGLRVLIRAMPVILATYGSIIFAEELFAVYALYFIVLKGGQYLEQSRSTELKSIGKALQEISSITATATTTLMVRLLEMTFWASRQCLDVSLQIGCAIFSPLLPAAPDDTMTEANLCRDLILASTNLSEGMQFKTPELKVISAPLENYLALNSQQLFGDWRVGKEKRFAVESFLFNMRVLDANPGPIELKLIEAQAGLEKIKRKPELYNSKTKDAIDQVEQVIDLLKEPENSEMQLVVFER